MRANTAIGEIGLEHPDGRYVILRPSFLAMVSLGTPEEIVEKFTEIHAAPTLGSHGGPELGQQLAAMQINRQRLRDDMRSKLYLSWEILSACSTEDLAPFIGEPGSRYASYRFALVPFEVMVAMAQSLIQHGIIGPMPKKQNGDPVKPDKSKYVAKFEGIKFASLAMANLGLNEDQAWNMTMTGFAAAWEAKHGENKQERHSEEHDDTMNWLKKVNEQRKPKP